MAINFGLLDTSTPEKLGALPGNALAKYAQTRMQMDDRAQAREAAKAQNALARTEGTLKQFELIDRVASHAAANPTRQSGVWLISQYAALGVPPEVTKAMSAKLNAARDEELPGMFNAHLAATREGAQKQIALAEEKRKADEYARQNSPEYGAALRVGARGLGMPDLPEGTPPEAIEKLIGAYSAAHSAGIRSGTPHGRQWAEVNWTNPVTGAQDRHLLNMLDGSRWSLDGVTQLSPPIKSWTPPAGAGEAPTPHAGHGAQPAPAAPSAPASPPAPSPQPAAAPPAPDQPAAQKPKRPVAPGPRFSNTPAGAAAKAIYDGTQPPDLKNQRFAAGVRQELERNGFNLSDAQIQWTAAQKNVAALNSTQQTRLRQAIGSAPHMLDNIESLYGEFEKLGGPSGFRIVNKATLAAAKQVPGRLGEVAQALEANIADLVSDLGTIYQGGNTPTEHAMHLALQNLDANWTPGQFRELLKQARKNIGYRLAAMDASGPVGTGGENRYAPKAAASAGMDNMPPPAEHVGREIVDTVTGVTYRSDGRSWVRVP